jgi:hypothetical protein
MSGTGIYAWVRCAERATLTPMAGSAIFDRARNASWAVVPLRGSLVWPLLCVCLPRAGLRGLVDAALFCFCQLSLLRPLLLSGFRMMTN